MRMCVPSTAPTVLASLAVGAHCPRSSSHSLRVEGARISALCTEQMSSITLLQTFCTVCLCSPNCSATSLYVTVLARRHRVMATALSVAMGGRPSCPGRTHWASREAQRAVKEERESRNWALYSASLSSGTTSLHQTPLQLLPEGSPFSSTMAATNAASSSDSLSDSFDESEESAAERLDSSSSSAAPLCCWLHCPHMSLAAQAADVRRLRAPPHTQRRVGEGA